jgi:hypothetical protein
MPEGDEFSYGQMTDEQQETRLPFPASGPLTCYNIVAGTGFEPATSGL